MSHPPIPESEFSPPWHQYFVKLRDYITGYFTATDARLDAAEASIDTLESAAVETDDEDWPIGCVALLSPNTTRTYTAGEMITLSGTELNAPSFYQGGGSVLYLEDAGPTVGVGTWQLLNPPIATGSKGPYRFFNFKRIS